MKVALIVPPYPLAESPVPPLGLCYAAAAFEAAGAQVRVLDYLVRRYTPEKLCGELEEFQPDIVGTNSVTLNFFPAADILRVVKQGFPSAVTVMGGPHVTFDYRDTLARYPEIDLIVVGEGEETIREWLPEARNRERWPDIKGLAFTKDGETIFTGRRKFIEDLASLPTPALHLIPLSRYQAIGFAVSVITSRGCPNRCIFCQGRRLVGAKVRYRDIARVVDEIEVALGYGYTRINIADDCFTVDNQRVIEFCDEIERRKLKFGWSVFARADSVNRDLLQRMLDAGCDAVLFGIESGNQAMLDRVRKGVTLERIREAVADCHAVGMQVVGTFIVGLPGETLQTMTDSDRFAHELDIGYGYHFLAPFPGTPVKEKIEHYDLELLTNDWSRFDANRAIVRTSQLSPEEMERFVQEKYYDVAQDEEEKIRARCREGRGSEGERLLCFGKEKQEIVHQLFAEDIIETHGVMPLVGDNGCSQELLAKELAAILDKDPATVEQVLRHVTASGYLKSKKSGDSVAWYWTHNNRIDEPPPAE